MSGWSARCPAPAVRLRPAPPASSTVFGRVEEHDGGRPADRLDRADRRDDRVEAHRADRRRHRGQQARRCDRGRSGRGERTGVDRHRHAAGKCQKPTASNSDTGASAIDSFDNVTTLASFLAVSEIVSASGASDGISSSSSTQDGRAVVEQPRHDHRLGGHRDVASPGARQRGFGAESFEDEPDQSVAPQVTFRPSGV